MRSVYASVLRYVVVLVHKFAGRTIHNVYSSDHSVPIPKCDHSITSKEGLHENVLGRFAAGCLSCSLENSVNFSSGSSVDRTVESRLYCLLFGEL